MKSIKKSTIITKLYVEDLPNVTNKHVKIIEKLLDYGNLNGGQNLSDILTGLVEYTGFPENAIKTLINELTNIHAQIAGISSPLIEPSKYDKLTKTKIIRLHTGLVGLYTYIPNPLTINLE